MMTIYQWIIVLVVFRFSVAEDVMPGSEAIEGPDDACIIGLFCIPLALFVSFLAVVVGHYSFLEDLLMKKYLQSATLYEAAVLSAQFSRAGTTNDPSSMCTRHENAQCEYEAKVEYYVVQSDKQRRTVRKQVKVFGADFKKASRPSSDIPHAIDIEFASVCPSIREDDLVSVFCGKKVDVLVMPGYARSGLPRSQVLRACTLSYRMPTAGFLFFLLVIAGGCFDISFKLLAPAAWTSYQLALIVLVAVIFIEVFLVVGCWGEGMRDGIHEIYLNGGEYVQLSHDDTTISSGDDSYLRTDSYSRL